MILVQISRSDLAADRRQLLGSEHDNTGNPKKPSFMMADDCSETSILPRHIDMAALSLSANLPQEAGTSPDSPPIGDVPVKNSKQKDAVDVTAEHMRSAVMSLEPSALVNEGTATGRGCANSDRIGTPDLYSCHKIQPQPLVANPNVWFLYSIPSQDYSLSCAEAGRVHCIKRSAAVFPDMLADDGECLCSTNFPRQAPVSEPLPSAKPDIIKDL